MTLERKDRLVSFRLSDQEHRALRGFCISNGIRNLSDFARSALSQLVEAQNTQSGRSSLILKLRAVASTTRSLVVATFAVYV